MLSFVLAAHISLSPTQPAPKTESILIANAITVQVTHNLPKLTASSLVTPEQTQRITEWSYSGPQNAVLPNPDEVSRRLFWTLSLREFSNVNGYPGFLMDGRYQEPFSMYEEIPNLDRAALPSFITSPIESTVNAIVPSEWYKTALLSILATETTTNPLSPSPLESNGAALASNFGDILSEDIAYQSQNLTKYLSQSRALRPETTRRLNARLQSLQTQARSLKISGATLSLVAKVTKVITLITLLESVHENELLELQDTLAAAQRAGATIDPNLLIAVSGLVASTRSDASILSSALLSVLTDSVASKGFGAIANQLILAAANQRAVALGLSGAARASSAGLFAHTITSHLSVFSLGITIGDVLFDLDGLALGARRAAYLLRIAEQCERALTHIASTKSNPNADVTTFAKLRSFRALGMANFHMALYDTLANKGGVWRWIDPRAPERNADSIDRYEDGLTWATLFLDPPNLRGFTAKHNQPAVIAEKPSTLILIDRSGSITDNRNIITSLEQDARNIVIALLEVAPEVAVMNFAGAGSTVLDQPPTRNTDGLVRAIQRPGVTSGGTAIFDAILALVNNPQRPRRSMIILFTDGYNNEGSEIGRAIRACAVNQIELFIVGYVGSEGRNDAVLSQLARSTGGLYVKAEDLVISQLVNRYTAFTRIRNQSRLRDDG